MPTKGRGKKQTSKLRTVESLTNGNFSWVNVKATTNKEILELKKRFNFHEDDLASALPPTQRPQIVERDDYLFVIFMFPTYDRKAGIMHRTEVDFFLGKNYVVTVHQNKLESIKRYYGQCADAKTPECVTGEAGEVMYRILYRLLRGIHEMLVHMGNDIDDMHEQVVEGARKSHTIAEILRVKMNVSTLRSSVQSHKRLISKLTSYGTQKMSWRQFDRAMLELKEDAKENWDLTQNYLDTINAIHDAFTSSVNVKTGDIMKVLTLLTATMLPLSLVTTTFAMDLEGMPFRGPGGFMIVFGVMIIMGVLSYWFYIKKRWL
tara:strand:- start:167 stop:1123 length:957 start_codon:yes stop_codon:yes gene_type:complete